MARDQAYYEAEKKIEEALQSRATELALQHSLARSSIYEFVEGI